VAAGTGSATPVGAGSSFGWSTVGWSTFVSFVSVMAGLLRGGGGVGGRTGATHGERREQAGTDDDGGGGEGLGDRLGGQGLLGDDDRVLEARIGDRREHDGRPELLEARQS